jgi:hypothetical protein
MRHKTITWLIAGLLFSAWSAYAQEPDWTSYQTLLKHVKPGSKNNVSLMLVDYSAIKNNGSLDKAYRDLAAFKLERLTSREEKLAFYINAYNILAMKIVADHWPTESIKDIGNLFSPVWDKPAGELGGKTVTLGEVEHSILRPMGEPRIHLAIVCASVSCPDLRDEPYLAAGLDEQLAEQTRRFLNNTGKGLRVEENTIHVSKIFDWFEDDFKSQGGISAFIKRYKTGLPELILKTSLPYDWAVNGTQ